MLRWGGGKVSVFFFFKKSKSKKKKNCGLGVGWGRELGGFGEGRLEYVNFFH